MIKKVSELLEIFIGKEIEKLEEFSMDHMPTLGSAYEELTKQGIDQDFILPANLDIRVVSGFISIESEMLPEQIDCMLVHGDGERYGLTNQYIYDIDKVLCIFEVKKTLNKTEFVSAFDHLGKVRRKYTNYFENKLRSKDFVPNISETSICYSQLTGEKAPDSYRQINSLSKKNQILFYSLVQESMAPVSIIHGYHGYKTEKGIRKVFTDMLAEKGKESGQGLGIPSLPTLVTSNNFCLIKTNGFPYLIAGNNDLWAAICSTRHNPIRIMLELIWSKISIYFDINMPWDDDLHQENLMPLLLAEVREVGDEVGWMYQEYKLSEKVLIRTDDASWEPVKVCKFSISMINVMTMDGGYLHLNSDLKNYIQSEGGDFEEALATLMQTRVFLRDGEYVKPIHKVTLVIINEDGTGYIATEKPRFEQWCSENNIEPNFLVMVFM